MKKIFIFLSTLFYLFSWQILASTYPQTLVDVTGAEVILNKEPKKIILQDGRDLMTLALLDRADPFQRIVAWNNLLLKSDLPQWESFVKKWPHAKNIINMGFSDKGEVNVEEIIARKPDLIVAQWRAKKSLEETGVLTLGIPVLFLDTYLEPLKNTTKSIELLGAALNRNKEAKEYVDFYQENYQKILGKIDKQQKKPLVFMEAKAGTKASCCYTHANVGWDALLAAIKVDTIGRQLIPGLNGEVALEKIIAMEPDVYIASSAQTSAKKIGNMAIPFGFEVTQAQIDTAMNKLRENRPGFLQIKAIKNNNFYGIHHILYNHSYNIVAMAILAKFVYPELFTESKPEALYDEIIKRFTQLPLLTNKIIASQAPIFSKD